MEEINEESGYAPFKAINSPKKRRKIPFSLIKEESDSQERRLTIPTLSSPFESKMEVIGLSMEDRIHLPLLYRKTPHQTKEEHFNLLLSLF